MTTGQARVQHVLKKLRVISDKMAMLTRQRSNESEESDVDRKIRETTTSEEESGGEISTASEDDQRGSRPENVKTYRCTICRISMKTTREKAQNHTKYCASKEKKKNLKTREKARNSGTHKRKGKKGKQSRMFY